MNLYRKKPDPDIASLTERFEAANKYETPADRYMALGDVYFDTQKALGDRMIGPTRPDIYYPNIMRTSGAFAVLGGIVGMIVAPHVMIGLALGAVFGFGGGNLTEFARIEIYGRMDKTKKQLDQLLSQISGATDVTNHQLELEQLQKSPLFEGFNKKYPDIVDLFRMAAVRLATARKVQDEVIAPQPGSKASPRLTL